MNTVVTSREAILQSCRELISQNGLEALNMRAVAVRCNVALGSLYNYFLSKQELTLAAVESVWQDIFHMNQACEPPVGYCAYTEQLFERVKVGMVAYPRFFTAHSMSFAAEDKGSARQMMERYFAHMKAGLTNALKQDPAVRPDAFVNGLTQAEMVDFTVSNLLMVLMQRQQDCGVLQELIRRALY